MMIIASIYKNKDSIIYNNVTSSSWLHGFRCRTCTCNNNCAFAHFSPPLTVSLVRNGTTSPTSKVEMEKSEEVKTAAEPAKNNVCYSV